MTTTLGRQHSASRRRRRGRGRPERSPGLPFRERVGRRVADRRDRVSTRAGERASGPTTLGWAAIAFALVAVAAAIGFGWLEFAAGALITILALVTAVPFVLGRAEYQVEVRLAATRVVVGERAVGEVVVRNVARRTAPGAVVDLPVGLARASFRLPRLRPEAGHEELFVIPTQRRAVLTVGPVTSVRSDPLGLIRRQVRWTRPSELYVHPRTIHLEADATGFLRDLEGITTRDLSNDDVSFHALREYSPGDDLRYVHWKSSARTQTLMVRQFEETRRSHLVVALSTQRADYADDDEFELAVSVAGSLGTQALRGGKDLSTVTTTGTLSAPTALQYLDRLCALQPVESGRPLDDVARTITTSIPGASVVALVTGSTIAPVRLRAASLRMPPLARTFAIRVTAGGTLTRTTIGDLPTVTVPDLPSLRPAIRAVTT